VRRPSLRRNQPGTEGQEAVAPDLTNTTSCYLWASEQTAASRPQYLWGSMHAARLASALGRTSVSVVEFGVAGGNGLLALETAAGLAERLFGVRVEVYGFDVGTGMPAPHDVRDLPWAIEPGIFAMDEAALRARLRRAELVLGPVEETVRGWMGRERGPLGFCAFDLDLYTATAAALSVFDGAADGLLPRVACYFDDIFGYGWSDFAGERAAITEFNAGRESRKIGAIHGLKYELPRQDFERAWPEQIYLAHIFDSPDYNTLEACLPAGWAEAHRLSPG